MEWPKAAWELQNKQLSSAATTSWHFVSYMTDDDADSSVGHKFMASKINSDQILVQQVSTRNRNFN